MFNPPRRVRRSAVAVASAMVLLTGCAGFSPDGGLSPVQQAARDRLGSDVSLVRDAAGERRVGELLAQPLSADGAVQVALLNNPGLRAAFAELGVREADAVQAGLLPNPGFSVGRLTRGGELEIDRGVQFNLARLLTLPLAARIEAQRFDAGQREAAIQVLRLAAQTRLAWVDAVAAAQALDYAEQVQRSADAGAELARRMRAAGNWNRLSEARELGFRSEAVVALGRARVGATQAREHLTRLLGASASQAGYRLPDQLPALPESLPTPEAIAQRAATERLDVQLARLQAEQTARSLGMTTITRFVNVLELGAVRNSFSDGSTERGVTLSIELPLFDWGTARVRRAEATYQQALLRAAEAGVKAQSQVREADAILRTRHAVARHYGDEVVPLARRVADENLLRYNGMLISVFELLADARAQVGAVTGALDAQRDFWRAHAALDAALIGTPALDTPLSRELP